MKFKQKRPTGHNIKQHDVIVVEDRAAYVDRISDEEHEFSEGYGSVNYSFIEPDGTVGERGGRIDASVAKTLKHVEFAEVSMHVELPPEWKQRAAQHHADEKAKNLRRAELLDDGNKTEHPAFGFCRVSRVSGHTALFASPFKHQHYMSLTIGRSERHRSLGRDWHHGHGRELVEVAFSEAQWARMITSLNAGSGTPCTIQHVGGRQMPACPEEHEAERFHEDMQRAAEHSMKFMDEALEKMQALLDDKAPTKAKREAVLGALKFAQRKLTDTAPFVAKQLQARMEDIISDGKTEIEAFAQRTIVEAGILELAKANLAKGAAFDPKIIEMPPARRPIAADAEDDKE